MKNLLFIIGFGFVLFLKTQAQMIDNCASYRNIESDKYMRVHYENDYFSKSDIYYTQGINVELVTPAISKFPISRLLIKSAGKEMKHGVAIEHLGFTPTSISSSEILYGDRPFASCLFLKTFAIINDTIRNMRISSALSSGIIGPGAGGEEFQAAIHRWINDTQPLGWSNQIRNDIIVNYQIDFEKKLISHRSNLLVIAKTGIRAGTLNNKMYGSLVIMAGSFNDSFKYFSRHGKNFQCNFFAEPQLYIVGYDATLQGGLLNRTSPYTLDSHEISRVVFQSNMGVVIKVKRLSIEYFQSVITKEFESGEKHHWGGVRIAWHF